MITGGIAEAQGSYYFDLFNAAEDANAVPAEKSVYLRAFLMQAATWDVLEATGRLPESVYRHLRATQIPDHTAPADKVVDLLVRYREEWKRIVSERRDLGFHWARLLDPAREHVEQGLSHDRN
jgi:hypothetical protein